MSIYTKVNGSWKNITDIEVKNSIFNTVTKGYVKVNDLWKLFLSSNELDELYFINILQIVIPQPQDPLQYLSNTIATITISQPVILKEHAQQVLSNTIATITILTPTVV